MKEKYFEQYDKLVEPLCSMCKERFDERLAHPDDEYGLETFEAIHYGWQWSVEEWSFWNMICKDITSYEK